MDRTQLFSPINMGELTLSNRVLMAPLTRNRSNSDGTPTEMAQIYYNQRAAAGLIFSEATQISDIAKGYLDTPGIYTKDHVKGWKPITDAVHAGGGLIFCQLWHVGRISHVSLLPDGKSPVAPSAIQADAQTFTADGFQDCSEPVALTKDGIKDTIADFVTAARCAKEAGFDGIEVHSANGYLLDQFLQDGTNKRDDEYGGSLENRTRLLAEVLEAVSEIWPRNRIGVRLSPLGHAGDISDSDPEATFSYVYDMLDKEKLAYLHVVEEFPGNDAGSDEEALIKKLRKLYSGFYIGNGGYDADRAAEAIGSGYAHAITFGRPFIANPDLPERYRTEAELNEPNDETFYGGGAEGYIDYPFLRKEGENA